MSPIKSFRRANKLTQQQLADAAGIRSKAYISSIESGAETCSLKVALRLEQFSHGEIDAAAICPEAAKIRAGAGFAEARP
jgi:transcriptional regulator with XRE-family HTH domain